MIIVLIEITLLLTASVGGGFVIDVNHKCDPSCGDCEHMIMMIMIIMIMVIR